MTDPTTTNTAKDKRIPVPLSRQSILADFCQQYLVVLDAIAEYNKEVLSEKDSDWTPTKVLVRAKELGHPESGEPNADIKNALDAFESAQTALSQARRNVLEVTSKLEGITLSSFSERNAETEAPLKEKRKLAAEIGNQLSTIAKMTNDEKAAGAVTEFLESNPLPAVGRDQARTFGTDEKATPKYRVNVVVYKDGNEVINEAGFTKGALALTKFYDRGQSPKSDKLREAWEQAGNSVEKTTTNPVEFDDNGLHFVISKK